MSTAIAKHIGIVAASPEGSGLCYRAIFRHASLLVGDSGHPTVSLHNQPLEEYLDAVHRDDWRKVGEMLAASAKALIAGGAELLITPDNLMQHAVHLVESRFSVPWIKMSDVVAASIVNDKRPVVGLIGTKLVMFGSTYQTYLGIRGVKVIIPEAADAEMFDAVIFRELVPGKVVDASRQLWIEAIKRLADRGATGVILGCTEAPLLIDPKDSPLPIYDSTSLLAQHAAKVSLGLA